MTDIITTGELHRVANVSRQMISRWSREGLEQAAKVGRGKWDREAALSWIADRREDSPNFDGAQEARSDLNEARIRLYTLQGDGVSMRNALLEASVVFRDSAVKAFSATVSEMIAAGDAWARDATTPACKPLLEHLSPAAVLALKAELCNEYRSLQAEAVRRVAGTLAAGEDVGSARTRLPGRVGRR